MRTSFVSSLLLSSLFLCLGCGGEGDDPRTLVHVKGKVTVDGAPVDGVGLGVVFAHEKGYNPTLAPLAADGTFEGEAAVGPNEVMIITAGSSDGAHVDAKDKKVHASFMSPGSGLSATVDSNPEKNDFTFEAGPSAAGASGGPAAAHGRSK